MSPIFDSKTSDMLFSPSTHIRESSVSIHKRVEDITPVAIAILDTPNGGTIDSNGSETTASTISQNGFCLQKNTKYGKYSTTARITRKKQTCDYPLISPRAFNTITIQDDVVIKSSSSVCIHGELFFYQNIPWAISSLFPKLHWYKIQKSDTTIAQTVSEYDFGIISFAIDRVYGPTLSTLLVSGQLRCHHLRSIIVHLRRIHDALPPPQNHSGLVYSNYSSKLRCRWNKHRDSVYRSLSITNSCHYIPLIQRLQAYEIEDRGYPVGAVHGDPVFTNVIAPEDDWERLKFIDMRGAQGDLLAMYGDAVYDLAKVFQSLCLYDFIIGDVTTDSYTMGQMSQLHGEFQNLLNEYYPGVKFEDVILITCSLYFSLIPLHERDDHMKKFGIVTKVLFRYIMSIDEGQTEYSEKSNWNTDKHKWESCLSELHRELERRV